MTLNGKVRICAYNLRTHYSQLTLINPLTDKFTQGLSLFFPLHNYYYYYYLNHSRKSMKYLATIVYERAPASRIICIQSCLATNHNAKNIIMCYHCTCMHIEQHASPSHWSLSNLWYFSKHLLSWSVHRWTWQVEHKVQGICLLPHSGRYFLVLVLLTHLGTVLGPSQHR